MRLTLVFLCFVEISNCQLSRTYDVLTPFGYSGGSSEFTASGGAGVARTGLSSAAIVNPAGIRFSGLTVTAEAGERPRTSFMFIQHYDRVNLLPSFVSVGMPIGIGSVQAGYHRSYDVKWSTSPIPLTTTENPEGTGESFVLTSSTTIHTGFAGVAFSPTDGIVAGITAGIDFIDRTSGLSNVISDLRGRRVQLSAGVIANLVTGFEVGLVLRYAPDVEMHETADQQGLVLYADTTRGRRFLATGPQYLARSPFRAEAGVALTLTEFVTVMASTEYQDWARFGTDFDERWQVHTGVDARLTQVFSVQGGYSSLTYPVSEFGELYDQEFVSIGCSILFVEGLTLRAAYESSEPFTRRNVAGSYWGTKKSLFQTTFTMGCTVNL